MGLSLHLFINILHILFQAHLLYMHLLLTNRDIIYFAYISPMFCTCHKSCICVTCFQACCIFAIFASSFIFATSLPALASCFNLAMHFFYYFKYIHFFFFLRFILAHQWIHFYAHHLLFLPFADLLHYLYNLHLNVLHAIFKFSTTFTSFFLPWTKFSTIVLQ